MASANWRRRRCLRVSGDGDGPGRLATSTDSSAVSGSGEGSVAGSRRRPGWSSIPEAWQTMQHKREPCFMGSRCGQADCGVNAPIGKSGVNRKPRSPRRARLEVLDQGLLRDLLSSSLARSMPSCTWRTLTPSRAAILLLADPMTKVVQPDVVPGRDLQRQRLVGAAGRSRRDARFSLAHFGNRLGWRGSSVSPSRSFRPSVGSAVAFVLAIVGIIFHPLAPYQSSRCLY